VTNLLRDRASFPTWKSPETVAYLVLVATPAVRFVAPDVKLVGPVVKFVEPDVKPSVGSHSVADERRFGVKHSVST
jgi:hypothetical protein